MAGFFFGIRFAHVILADDVYVHFRPQLRIGIFAVGFEQLLSDRSNPAGYFDSVEDWGGCDGVGSCVAECSDQRGDKPIDNCGG